MNAPDEEPAGGPAGVQPNFDRIAECHQILATEMQYCQNLPLVAGLQQILTAIGRIEANLGRVEANLGRLEVNLTARLSANDHNSIARTQNSLLATHDDALSPLHNTATNTAIPNFPATPREIDQLQAPAVNATLEALGQGTAGTLPVKRQRIRMAVGLLAV